MPHSAREKRTDEERFMPERAMATPAIIWVEEVIAVEVRDGISCCTVRSREAVFEFRSTPALLWACICAGMRAHKDFLRQSTAKVLRFPGRRARH